MRREIWGLLLTGASVALGCTSILGADHTYELSAEASASSSAASAGGTGGTGGTGGGCSAPSDCPEPMNECVTVTCTCEVQNAPAGTNLAAQSAGDCKVAVCDGDGGITSEDDGTDFTDDMKDCTIDACDNGTPVHTPKLGTDCDQNGGKVCNAEGDCVECLTKDDCATPGALCSSGTCVPSTCDNHKKDGAETDVDCGGSQCLGCPEGGACAAPSDCVSLVCNGGVCEAPTCQDTVKNGAETDADCGGTECDACPDGKTCALPTDCASGVCNAVCQAPTCMDLGKNGAETDVDCGGETCAKCANGEECKKNADCKSNFCLGGSCF